MVDLMQQKTREVVKITTKINEVDNQTLIDSFLDKIIDIKKHFKELNYNIINLTDILESFSWVDNVSENDLFLIDIALELCDETSIRLSKNYAYYNNLCKKHRLFKEELTENKQAISDLKEVIEDIKLVFFILPKDDKFQSLSKEIPAIL